MPDRILVILARSVPRHLRYIAAMGVGQRLAADCRSVLASPNSPIPAGRCHA